MLAIFPEPVLGIPECKRFSSGIEAHTWKRFPIASRPISAHSRVQSQC